MKRLILDVITHGLIFLSLGTLAEITMQLMGMAARSTQSGLISLQRLNQQFNSR